MNKKSSRTKKETFVACRVLATKRDRKEYVVFPSSEVRRRRDVKRASKAFATEADAKKEVERLKGTIPTGFEMFLDFWEETAVHRAHRKCSARRRKRWRPGATTG